MAQSQMYFGERPFECDLCQKKFARSDVLRRHKATQHNNERLHKCAMMDVINVMN